MSAKAALGGQGDDALAKPLTNASTYMEAFTCLLSPPFAFLKAPVQFLWQHLAHVKKPPTKPPEVLFKGADQMKGRLGK